MHNSRSTFSIALLALVFSASASAEQPASTYPEDFSLAAVLQAAKLKVGTKFSEVWACPPGFHEGKDHDRKWAPLWETSSCEPNDSQSLIRKITLKKTGVYLTSIDIIAMRWPFECKTAHLKRFTSTHGKATPPRLDETGYVLRSSFLDPNDLIHAVRCEPRNPNDVEHPTPVRVSVEMAFPSELCRDGHCIPAEHLLKAIDDWAMQEIVAPEQAKTPVQREKLLKKELQETFIPYAETKRRELKKKSALTREVFEDYVKRMQDPKVLLQIYARALRRSQ